MERSLENLMWLSYNLKVAHAASRRIEAFVWALRSLHWEQLKFDDYVVRYGFVPDSDHFDHEMA